MMKVELHHILNYENKKQCLQQKTTPSGWAHPLNLTEGLCMPALQRENQHQIPNEVYELVQLRYPNAGQTPL